MSTQREYRVSTGFEDLRVSTTGDDMGPFKVLLRENLRGYGPAAGMWAYVPIDGTYRTYNSFLRTHGRFFEGKWTKRWKPAARTDACLNAMSNSLAHGLRYVEGRAFGTISYPKERRGIWTLWRHVWNADESGALVDTTTSNGALAYFGVEFSVDRAYDAWTSGSPGSSEVIWDEDRAWPMLRHLWSGEDYSRRFPRSRELDDLRGKPVGEVKRELKKRFVQLSAEYAQREELEDEMFMRSCRQAMFDEHQRQHREELSSRDEVPFSFPFKPT